MHLQIQAAEQGVERGVTVQVAAIHLQAGPIVEMKVYWQYILLELTSLVARRQVVGNDDLAIIGKSYAYLPRFFPDHLCKILRLLREAMLVKIVELALTVPLVYCIFYVVPSKHFLTVCAIRALKVANFRYTNYAAVIGLT